MTTTRQRLALKCAPAGLAAALLEDHYQLSNTQINLPEAQANFLIAWGRTQIKDDDLYYDEDGGKGRESEGHVTVLYGLTAQEPPKELREIVRQTPPFTIRLGGIGLFEDNKDYDVVKVGVASAELHALSNAVRLNCDNENAFPKYRPHVTIAYVKKGRGAKLAGDFPFKQGTEVKGEFEAGELLFCKSGDSEAKNRIVPLPFNRTKNEGAAGGKLPEAVNFKSVLRGLQQGTFVITQCLSHQGCAYGRVGVGGFANDITWTARLEDATQFGSEHEGYAALRRAGADAAYARAYHISVASLAELARLRTPPESKQEAREPAAAELKKAAAKVAAVSAKRIILRALHDQPNWVIKRLRDGAGKRLPLPVYWTGEVPGRSGRGWSQKLANAMVYRSAALAGGARASMGSADFLTLAGISVEQARLEEAVDAKKIIRQAQADDRAARPVTLWGPARPGVKDWSARITAEQAAWLVRHDYAEAAGSLNELITDYSFEDLDRIAGLSEGVTLKGLLKGVQRGQWVIGHNALEVPKFLRVNADDLDPRVDMIWVEKPGLATVFSSRHEAEKVLRRHYPTTWRRHWHIQVYGMAEALRLKPTGVRYAPLEMEEAVNSKRLLGRMLKQRGEENYLVAQLVAPGAPLYAVFSFDAAGHAAGEHWVHKAGLATFFKSREEALAALSTLRPKLGHRVVTLADAHRVELAYSGSLRARARAVESAAPHAGLNFSAEAGRLATGLLDLGKSSRVLL